MFKELYSFRVYKDKIEELEKTDGALNNPENYFDIVIKEPSRREMEQSDFEFSIEMSRCIKEGILTKGMLVKKYSDTGGVLSEDDAKAMEDLYSELGRIESEITKSTQKSPEHRSEKDEESIQKLYSSYAQTRNEIVTLESAYRNLFNHTADVKAQNKQILWYVVTLAHTKNQKGEYEPIYKGDTFEEKIESLYKMEEENDKLYSLCQAKISTVVVYWYHSSSPSKEEFDNLIRDIDG